MRSRALILFAVLAVPALLPAQGGDQGGDGVVVLKAARLFDGKGDRTVPNGPSSRPV